jgi:predicted nucleotide-binding protein
MDKLALENAITVLEELLKEGDERSSHFRSPLFEEWLELWTRRTDTKLRELGLSEAASRFMKASASAPFTRDRQGYNYDLLQARERVLTALLDDLNKHPEFYIQETKRIEPALLRTEPIAVRKSKVFLGHGRSLLWTKVERWLEKDKKLSIEAWESTSRIGVNVVQVLESMLSTCTFAVLVVTGEDATPAGTIRARQNVVHEVGLFQGKLGFRKVALLEQGGVEGFSNIDGLQTIRFAGDSVEATFPELERMMKREGLL